MNKLNKDIVLFELGKNLTLKEKLNLSQVNKKLSKTCRDSPYFNIGTLIGDFIGLELDYLDDKDLEILKEDRFEIIICIIEFLLNEKNFINNNVKINTYFSVGSLVKLRGTNKTDCIDMIRENNFLKRDKENYYNPRFLNNNYKNVYSLLLC